METNPAIDTLGAFRRSFHDPAGHLGKRSEAKLVDYFLNDLDDVVLTKCRLAPVIKGRRTGPAQKGEHPAR